MGARGPKPINRERLSFETARWATFLYMLLGRLGACREKSPIAPSQNSGVPDLLALGLSHPLIKTYPFFVDTLTCCTFAVKVAWYREVLNMPEQQMPEK